MWKIPLFNWLSIISLLLALAIFLIPQINDKDKWIIRIILVTILLLTPVLIQTVLWIVKISLVIYKKTTSYPSLYRFYQNTHSRLLEVEQQLVFYVSNCMKHYMFEISRTTYQRNQLYVSLKKKETFNLNVDDVIIVIDKNDLYIMGQFKVTEIRTDAYYAVGTKLIDPLWLSFVRENGEVEMTPSLVAYYEKIGEQDVQ